MVTFQLENYFQPKQNSEEPQNRTKVYLIRALTIIKGMKEKNRKKVKKK